MDARFSLFIVGMFTFLIGWTWATSDTGLCSLGIVKAATADGAKDGATTCFEFWLYRYQALLGVLATVGAALYAGRWVRRQIHTTQEQIELARAQVSGDWTRTLDDRFQKVKDLRDFVENLAADFQSVQVSLNELIDEGLKHFLPEKADTADPEWQSNNRRIRSLVVALQNRFIGIEQACVIAKKSDKIDGVSMKLVNEFIAGVFNARSLNRQNGSTVEIIEDIIYAKLRDRVYSADESYKVFKFAQARAKMTINEMPYNRILVMCMQEQMNIVKLKDECNQRVDALIAEAKVQRL